MWEFGQSVKLPPLRIGGSIPHAPTPLRRAHGKTASRQSGRLEPRGASPRCPIRARRSTADRDPDAIKELVRLQPCPPTNFGSRRRGRPHRRVLGWRRARPSFCPNPQSSIPSASSHKQQCSGFISRPSRCESGGSHFDSSPFSRRSKGLVAQGRPPLEREESNPCIPGRFGHAAGPPRSKRDSRREPSWEFDSPTFLSRRGAANGKPSRC